MYSIYKNNYIKYISILLILTLVLSSCGKNNNVVKREGTPPVTEKTGGTEKPGETPSGTGTITTGTGTEEIAGTGKEINGTGTITTGTGIPPDTIITDTGKTDTGTEEKLIQEVTGKPSETSSSETGIPGTGTTTTGDPISDSLATGGLTADVTIEKLKEEERRKVIKEKLKEEEEKREIAEERTRKAEERTRKAEEKLKKRKIQKVLGAGGSLVMGGVSIYAGIIEPTIPRIREYIILGIATGIGIAMITTEKTIELTSGTATDAANNAITTETSETIETDGTANNTITTETSETTTDVTIEKLKEEEERRKAAEEKAETEEEKARKAEEKLKERKIEKVFKVGGSLVLGGIVVNLVVNVVTGGLIITPLSRRKNIIVGIAFATMGVASAAIEIITMLI